MALINGNEYDHIDFTKNGVTTRHPFKDTLSRQMSSDLVKVQDEEPTSEGTKIWIKPSGDSEVQVPTYAEFEELSDKINDADATIESLAVGAQPTVTVTDVDGHKRFSFGIPASNGIASITKTATDGVIDTYTIAMTDGTSTSFSVNNSDITPESMAEAIATALQDYARIDGYYPDLTAGNADQLNSTKFVENKEPYLYRPSGGTSDIGNRKYLDAIVGVSLPWNQMVRDEASENQTDFADILTVTDAVEDSAALKVKIEPQQDLHGYDHPWPAGGGVNLAPPVNSGEYRGVVCIMNSDGTTSVSGTAEVNGGRTTIRSNDFELKAGTYTFSADTNSASTYASLVLNKGDTAFRELNQGVQRQTFTLDSDIDNFNVGINVVAESSYSGVLKFQIEAGSTATTWTPYSNICPITGWDGVQVWDDPKYGGLIEWNQLVRNGDFSSSGNWAKGRSDDTMTISDGVATFTIGSAPENYYSHNMQQTLVSGTSSDKYAVFASIKSVRDNVTLGVTNSSGASTLSKTVTPNEWTRIGNILNIVGAYNSLQISPGFDYSVYVAGDTIQVKDVICLNLTTMFGSYQADVIFNMEKATPGSGIEWVRNLFTKNFYPYNEGEITTVGAVNGDPYKYYSITLPSEAGTVYGGELTVNADGSGSLVVDRASVDLGTLNWSRAESNTSGVYYFYTASNTVPAKYYSGDEIKNHLISSAYQIVVANTFVFGTASNGSISINDGLAVRARNDNYTDAETFKTAMSGVQLVYELATPITYTLTADQVMTILGTNNIWADTGDVALTYTGTDEHLTLESGKKYLARINGTDSMLLGSGQEITAAKGADNVFDLTKMFGTSVADYVYNQGAGYFRKWFGKTWYPYNTGELKHVEGLQSHDLVGFNVWDEEWELGAYNMTTGVAIASNNTIRTKNRIPVIGGASYCSLIGTYSFWYDSDDNFIEYIYFPSNSSGYSVVTAPVNARYMRFYKYGTTYNHNICIHLAHNNSRNGEYEPYEKHSHPLDNTVILRGIPKVDSNGVYWDGDRYLPDGTVERMYGVVDLGSLDWAYYATGNYFYCVVPDRSNGYCVCEKYPFYGAYTDNHLTSNMPDKAFGITTQSAKKYLYVKDSRFANTVAFKAAMSGVMLVYELKEPTIEQALPYRNFQLVDDWGTEEFVTTGMIPVGHESRYPANLRDKLQHLPDAASSNGSYLITQTDGQMTLTSFPAPPTTAGKYALRATVTNGVATFTWEATT